MPKILDLELKASSLALRVIVSIIAAAIMFFVLYYLPANLLSFLSQFVPAQALPPPSTLNPLLSSIIDPTLPMIGLLLTVLVFLEYLLRGSKAYGPILILTSLSFIAYLYLFFNGGTMIITLPANLLMGISVDIALDLTVIMLLLMLPSILNIIKGIVLMTKKSSP
jgi:hypothetical protein